ncbi:MAG TPA: hypothetical protein PLW40_04660, partial [Syntrophales bacterium]|nr:hypothetical protein [Syntrophales bacterium]
TIFARFATGFGGLDGKRAHFYDSPSTPSKSFLKNGPFCPKNLPPQKNRSKEAVFGADFDKIYYQSMGSILDQKRTAEGVCRRADVGRLLEIIE